MKNVTYIKALTTPIGKFAIGIYDNGVHTVQLQLKDTDDILELGEFLSLTESKQKVYDYLNNSGYKVKCDPYGGFVVKLKE